MESNSHAITSFRKVIKPKPPRYVRYSCTNKCIISVADCQATLPFLATIAFAMSWSPRYNDGVLARANPTEEVTEMFCNFDCASLLKMLCSFFGC